MFRCKPLAVAVFAVWTIFIWGQRLVNIANDDDLAGFDLAWSTGRAVVFVLVGLAVAVVAVKPVAAATRKKVVTVAAGVTIALWSVQVILIAFRDYSAGFIIVHAVLGAISIGLAVWATRSANQLAATVSGRSGDPRSVAGI